MQFKAWVKSIKHDVAKGEITLTFTLPRESLDTVETLAPYTVEDAGAVELTVLPHQRPLFPPKVEEVTITHGDKSVTLDRPL